jgi:hypothetical protein
MTLIVLCDCFTNLKRRWCNPRTPDWCPQYTDPGCLQPEWEGVVQLHHAWRRSLGCHYFLFVSRAYPGSSNLDLESQSGFAEAWSPQIQDWREFWAQSRDSTTCSIRSEGSLRPGWASSGGLDCQQVPKTDQLYRTPKGMMGGSINLVRTEKKVSPVSPRRGETIPNARIQFLCIYERREKLLFGMRYLIQNQPTSRLRKRIQPHCAMYI